MSVGYKFIKLLFIILGIASLTTGILGLFLPVLPTTPFLLLSAMAFAKSSNRLYNWLINHKLFGDYIRSFREEKAIPMRVKIISVSMLWTTILFSIFLVINDKHWLQLLLLIIAIAITIHILSYRTKKLIR